MARSSLLCAAAVCVATTAFTQTGAQDSPTMRAMADELARSMSSLKLPDQPAPYFIEYEVQDRVSTRVTARLGALVEDLEGRNRVLRVSVRVGSYDFDNSLFGAGTTGGVIGLSADGSTTAPLDDNYDTMRRQIWLATDAAYKRAVGVFARKRAAFQNRVGGGDVVPDFSRETPQQTLLEGLPAVRTNRDWPERARQISAAFSGFSSVESSEVSVADTRGTRFYINSEGFTVVAPVEIASLRVGADTQAADGMAIRDAFTLVEKDLRDLPPVTELATRARRMAERLTAQRVAPIGEEYTGPVLLEGQASAELVAGALAPAVLGRRPPETAGRGGRGGVSVSPFHRRIGLRVMSEGFSASDTPSLRQFEGRPVAGAYTVDDHGVRAKDVSLIEKGRLLTLLAGRAPLKGLLQSSGHTRGQDVLPGVFQLQTAEPMSAAELRQKYLELLATQDKPFGYIVRGLASPAEAGGGAGGPMIVDAVKVTRDGREEIVRGVRLGAVVPAVFRDLYGASRERTLYNFRGATNDAVSIIAPNIIYEELEVQQTRDITQKPPEVKSPLTIQ